MSRIRLFTTDAAAVRARSHLATPIEFVEVGGLDRPPPQLAGGDEEWPPVIVGVAADLSRASDLRSRGVDSARLTFGLEGPELLDDPEVAESLRELQQEGCAVDVVVYLGGYGGAR